MEIMRFAAICLILLISSSIGLAIADDGSVPDGTIYGHVYDAQTKQPVSGAFAYCQDAKCMPAATDTDGYYAIENCFSPSSTYVIECTKNGYISTKSTAKTDSSGKAEVDFHLELEPQKSSSSIRSPKPNSIPTQVKSWEKTYGGTGNESGNSVRQTSDDGYVIAGKTNSYGAGGYDAWLIKTDANGNVEWDRTFGGLYDDAASSVQQTRDGGYIIAGCTGSYDAGLGDFWLIKADASGNKEWDRTFGGSNFDESHSVQQTSDGGYIIAGLTYSYGAGKNDAWLIKTDESGNKVWDRIFGGSDYDMANSVQQTSDGGYIIAGQTVRTASAQSVWLIKTDANGNKVWDRTFGESGDNVANSVQQVSDGGYIIAGYSGYKAWLIKTDASGNKEWDWTFGGSYYSSAMSVQQVIDEGYIITGVAFNNTDRLNALLIKTDSQGNEQWDKIFGWPKGGSGSSARQTSDGGYIIVSGSQDIWLIKTDFEGN